MENKLLLCCGEQPITSIRHEAQERGEAAYIIRCVRCGRVAVEIFTDDTWPEAKEKAREKWNRRIVEEIKL